MTPGAGLALALAAAPWAVPPPPPDPLGDLERAAALRSADAGEEAGGEPACEQVGGDAILVCGRRERFRRTAFPPIPGERRGLVAGEPPSAGAAMAGGGCIQRCEGSVGIVLDPVELFRDPVSALKRAFHIER